MNKVVISAGRHCQVPLPLPFLQLELDTCLDDDLLGAHAILLLPGHEPVPLLRLLGPGLALLLTHLVLTKSLPYTDLQVSEQAHFSYSPAPLRQAELLQQADPLHNPGNVLPNFNENMIHGKYLKVAAENFHVPELLDAEVLPLPLRILLRVGALSVVGNF